MLNIDMTRSLVTTTYDVLAYAGHGNFGTFDRSFSKVVAFLSLDLDADKRRKLRNHVFHYLRTVGYIDVGWAGSDTKWTLSPPCLVQRADNDFVLIGGSGDERRLREHAASVSLREIPPVRYLGELPDRISFFPALLQYTGGVADAHAVSAAAELALSVSYQSRLFSLLPSLASALRQVRIKVADSPLFEPNTASVYCFEEGAWKSFGPMRPHDVGFYRRDHEYAPPEHLVATRNEGQPLEVFRIISSDWAFVCGLAAMNNKLRVRYRVDGGHLSLERRFKDLRIPTIVERCLRSGTLLAPKIDSAWVTYSNVSTGNLWRLIGKLPIFKVEQV